MIERLGSDSDERENNDPASVERDRARVQDSGEPGDPDLPQLRADDVESDSGKGVEQRGQGNSSSNGQPGETVEYSSQQLAFMHAGPLPSVNEFAGYEQILPGAADRIIAMAEKSLDMEIEDRKAQRENERANQDDENFAMKLAAFGFTYLPWVCFISAVACAALGQITATWVAAAIGAISSGPAIIDSVKRKRK